MKNASTAFLMTCAVIGAAGGLLLLPANWLSTVLFATVPIAGLALAGLWILPAVIALRLLRRPGAGLLVGLVSGLVLVPVSGYGFTSIATNLWWAFFAEAGFLVVAYRRWLTWQHYLGAGVVAVVYPLMSAQFYDLWSMTRGAQVTFFVLCLASCLAATWAGIAIADRLAHAGVARAARGSSASATQG